MICSKCKNPGVLNTANGKDFYYCRTCKDEIGLEIVKKSISIESELLSNSLYQDPIYDPDAPDLVYTDLWADLAHEVEFADKVSQMPTPSTSFCNICQGFH